MLSRLGLYWLEASSFRNTKVDCGAFSVANLWILLQGEDPTSTLFNEETLRSELYS